MRIVNICLSLAISLVMGLAVFEGGLRLIGLGPPVTLNRFDDALGWSKVPDVTITRATPEGFDITYAFNADGLRDDADVVPQKPPGTYRVVALGDSFTLGFTVERRDLFVDLLEDLWTREGRAVQVVNTGTEGYSTDQEVAWLLQHGADWQPDLVLLFAYDNDIYWNGQTEYDGLAKPRFAADGTLETGTLEDLDPPCWMKDSAIGRLFSSKGAGVPRFRPGTVDILREFGVLLDEQPEWMADPLARTGGALLALAAECERLGARVVVVPIPSHSAIDPDFATSFAERLGLTHVDWSADRPVDLFLDAARAAGIETLDARPFLVQRFAAEGDLYFQKDWHLNPAGNRALASFLHDSLEGSAGLPAATTSAELGAVSEPGAKGLPTPLLLFLALWTFLGTMYSMVYRDEPKLLAVARVGALLGVVFGLVLGLGKLAEMLPPNLARGVPILVVLCILGFVAYKLGNRLGTICELLLAFTRRGHWYLMPLVTILLTIGGLLVVAASSPLIAPFIYTLF